VIAQLERAFSSNQPPNEKLEVFNFIMADKEATVYIVDVGASMGRCQHGREITDLTWAMRYVWDRITATVI
jgi:hypothetical protein